MTDAPSISTVGVPREVKTAEHRVALTPDGVRELGSGRHSGPRPGRRRRAARRSPTTTTSPPARRSCRPPPTLVRRRWSSRSRSRRPRSSSSSASDLTLFTYLHLAAYPAVAEALLAAKTTAVAYETVQLDDGTLPLLAPMSEVAGRLAPQMGAHFLERHKGGRGVLMGGVPGVSPAKVVVLGAGNVGWSSAVIAAGMEAEVTVLDKNLERLRYVDQIHKGRISTLASNQGSIERTVQAPTSSSAPCSSPAAGPPWSSARTSSRR